MFQEERKVVEEHRVRWADVDKDSERVRWADMGEDSGEECLEAAEEQREQSKAGRVASWNLRRSESSKARQCGSWR